MSDTGQDRRERGAWHRPATAPVLAQGAAGGAQLADPGDHAAALVAGLVQGAPTGAVASPARRSRRRSRPMPVSPTLI